METIIGLPEPDVQRFKTYFGRRVFIPSSEALDDKPGYERGLAEMNTIRNQRGNALRLAAKQLGAKRYQHLDVFPALRAQDKLHNSTIVDNRTQPASTFGALLQGVNFTLYGTDSTIVFDGFGSRVLPPRKRTV